MYISPKASAARQREAQKARDNRAEIVKALSTGEITRRDLYRWGILTATGALALKNGLSPFAPPPPQPLPPPPGPPDPIDPTHAPVAVFPAATGERPAKRLSYHTDFT